MELTPQDADKISEFNERLHRHFGHYLRELGYKDYRDQNYDMWCIEYRWQIGMAVFVLFINTNMQHEDWRYGYYREM